MGCTCESPVVTGPPAESLELPTTGYQFIDPFGEDISRRILSSYFGSPETRDPITGEVIDPGYEGLISKERDIPIEGTADLTDLERQARSLSGNLGQFGEYIPEAAGVTREGIDAARSGVNQLGQGASNLTEAARLARDPNEAIKSFSDPFEQQVVQQAIRDITEQSQQQGIANRASAVDAGAFGGSRGRLQDSERQEALGRGLLEAVGGIRSQGFQGARDAAAQQVSQLGNLGQSMGTSGLAYSTLGQGISGLGSQLGSYGATGQDLLTGQIGTLENLGQAQRGMTQDALSRRFRAADVLADEPFTRLQRGQQLLAGTPMGGISGGTGSQLYQPQAFAQPSLLSQVAGAAATGAGIAGLGG